jgi:hypothetical protein
VARRQRRQLDSPAVEESVWGDEDGVEPLAHKGCELRIDFTIGACVEKLNLYRQDASSRFHISEHGRRVRNVGWIVQHGDPSDCGYQLTQKSQPLCSQLSLKKINTTTSTF